MAQRTGGRGRGLWFALALSAVGAAACGAPSDPVTAGAEGVERRQGALSAPAQARLLGDDMIAPDPAVQRLRPRLVTPAAPVKTRRLAILMVHFGTPDGATKEGIARAAFTDPDSMHALYTESSFGKIDMQGDVFGWFQIAPVTGCDVYAISQEARDAAAANEIDLDAYDHLLFYYPGIAECWFGGLGEVGTPSFPARQTWYNGWYGTYVLAHEIGHNLGFWHARSYECGTGAIESPSRCIANEYGDPYDPMGSSTAHFSAYHKAAQGWFESCDVVTARRTGIFRLEPIERATTAAQVLRVPIDSSLCPSWLPTPCFYYIEYRQPIGVFDGGPTYATSPMHQGVSIRADVDLDLSGNSGLQPPALLDMTPRRLTDAYSDFGDSRLANGQSFQDPSGLRIAVQSATPTAAQVAISVPVAGAAPACLDGTAVSQNAACSNRVRDQGESEVDCGGPCVPCNDGGRCATANDCWSRICTSGRCQPKPVTCEDGLKNGNESDVDCGGATCMACPNDSACNGDADCGSGNCVAGRCAIGQLQATARVYSDSQTGFCGDVTLVNTGTTLITNWSLKMKFADSTFTQKWNATYTSIGDSNYQVTPLAWNQKIWGSSTATIGFCANKTGWNYYPQILQVRYEP